MSYENSMEIGICRLAYPVVDCKNQVVLTDNQKDIEKELTLCKLGSTECKFCTTKTITIDGFTIPYRNLDNRLKKDVHFA